MRLLICNDDGVHSPGLATLAELARHFGDVLVMAPERERSSSGHAISASVPLRCRASKAVGGCPTYRVNGTPADAVALALHLWPDIDVVLSGLNAGLNLGPAAWHSGTIAAARQAALGGVRAIALSVPATIEGDDARVRPWIQVVLATLLDQPEGPPLVNVNVPREPRGVMWTRASTEGYDGRIIPGRDADGREIYWFRIEPVLGVDDQADRWAVEQGWVSMTPIALDVTDEHALETLRRVRPLDTVRAAQLSRPVSSDAEAARVREDEIQPPLQSPAS